MNKPIPIPPGFADYAAFTPTRVIAQEWGVSATTVQRWRKRLGVPNPSQKAHFFRQIDTPEQIRLCLHCEKKSCKSGTCLAVHEVKREAMTKKRAAKCVSG